MQRVRELAQGATEAKWFVHVVNAEGERVYAGADDTPNEQNHEYVLPNLDIKPQFLRDNNHYLSQEYLSSDGYFSKHWYSRDNLGEDVPVGMYTLRTGLRFSYPDGSVKWLTAAPQTFRIGGYWP